MTKNMIFFPLFNAQSNIFQPIVAIINSRITAISKQPLCLLLAQRIHYFKP